MHAYRLHTCGVASLDHEAPDVSMKECFIVISAGAEG